MKKAYADIPEGQIHYRIGRKWRDRYWLLHAGVNSSDEFTRAMPFLSKSYCAVAMDFLGHGESDDAAIPVSDCWTMPELSLILWIA